MRWLLTSWGSYGDLHPFLSLGRALQARGHTVTLVGLADWREHATDAGIRFVSVGGRDRGDFIRESPEVLSRQANGLVSLHALVHKAILPSFEPTLQALLTEIPNHDVMVAHHFQFPAPSAAELTGIPYATVTLAPCINPSAYGLPGGSFLPNREGLIGRMRNRTIWSIGRHVIRQMIDPAINQLRAKHGLKPARDVIFEAHSKKLNLQLYSEHFASRSPDWSAEKRIAGFCFYDPPGAPQLLPEIEEFLGKGEVPVLFTLGSVAVESPGPFFRSAAKALQSLGLRGILLIGSKGIPPRDLPDSILAASYAPYGLLMPRVKAVAHQCGIGTLSHTLRAGIPSVACPFAFDQPNNSRRLEELGVAEVLLPDQHTAPHIQRALERLLAGDASARARRLGELIRAEDGPSHACDILEETFTSPFS